MSADIRILLFDIDGTLVVPARRGVYRGQIRKALIDIFSTAGKIDEISFGGKTDLQILREALETEGITAVEIRAALPQIEARFTAVLTEMELEGSVFKCCEGVTTLLERLMAVSRYRLSLLTGNVEPLAKAKLTGVGLVHYFPYRGAFGSDNEDRLLLPAIACERITAALGVEQLAPEQFIVIGDTPRDIACARYFGARVMAVATGGCSIEELSEAKPDIIFENLAQTEEVMAALDKL